MAHMPVIVRSTGLGSVLGILPELPGDDAESCVCHAVPQSHGMALRVSVNPFDVLEATAPGSAADEQLVCNHLESVGYRGVEICNTVECGHAIVRHSVYKSEYLYSVP